MLDALLGRQEIGILLVQEVTHHVLNDFRGYTTQYNNGVNRRGSAIVARDGIYLVNSIMIPSGRARAAKFREVWVINVYAPCGTAMKHEREWFFNSDLPYFVTGASEHTLMGGDFNAYWDFVLYWEL